MSKGSTPRPFSVGADAFAANWEATFGRKDAAGAKDGPTINQGEQPESKDEDDGE